MITLSLTFIKNTFSECLEYFKHFCITDRVHKFINFNFISVGYVV
jgi:hypothetical protein